MESLWSNKYSAMVMYAVYGIGQFPGSTAYALNLASICGFFVVLKRVIYACLHVRPRHLTRNVVIVFVFWPYIFYHHVPSLSEDMAKLIRIARLPPVARAE